MGDHRRKINETLRNSTEPPQWLAVKQRVWCKASDLVAMKHQEWHKATQLTGRKTHYTTKQNTWAAVGHPKLCKATTISISETPYMTHCPLRGQQWKMWDNAEPHSWMVVDQPECHWANTVRDKRTPGMKESPPSDQQPDFWEQSMLSQGTTGETLGDNGATLVSGSGTPGMIWRPPREWVCIISGILWTFTGVALCFTEVSYYHSLVWVSVIWIVPLLFTGVILCCLRRSITTSSGVFGSF